jgi:vesicle-fusing ATPase
LVSRHKHYLWDGVSSLLYAEWTPIGPRFSNSVLQTLLVLIARRPPKGRRLLVLATTSLRPVLTELGLSEVFDSELRVPPVSSLRSLEIILKEVQLFPNSEDRKRAMGMIQQAGLGANESAGLNIGVKKLLNVIEMARQEPEAVGERLTTALMGLGM